MAATLAIVLLWSGFAATHLGLSSLRIRQSLIARLGQTAFLGVYSLLAFAFFIPLVWTYFTHKHAGPWLWILPRGPALLALMYGGMMLAFVLLVASLARPSPASVVPGDVEPRGIYRITRHPLFMAFVVFGLLHLLPNGSTADVAFFGGFVLFPLIGAWHQDQRKLVIGPAGYRQFHSATAMLPFSGPEARRGVRELSPLVVGLGIAAAFIVRHFHARWFG